MKLAGNPHKLFLMTALERKVLNRFDSFLDHLLNELFITGRSVVHPLRLPAKDGVGQEGQRGESLLVL